MANNIGSTVEGTISYLFFGLMILAFIVLTVFGMSQMQASAEKVESKPDVQVEEEVIDLGVNP